MATDLVSLPPAIDAGGRDRRKPNLMTQHTYAEAIACVRNGNRCRTKLSEHDAESVEADDCRHLWREIARHSTDTVHECRKCGRQRLTVKGVRRKWYARS
jgi:hypothetical protein